MKETCGYCEEEFPIDELAIDKPNLIFCNTKVYICLHCNHEIYSYMD